MIKSLKELKSVVNERFGKEAKTADESDKGGLMFHICVEELKNNLSDTNLIEDGNNKEVWEQFWELYLANYLLENGLLLNRKQGDSQPDFFFETWDGEKVNIEAKVANDAKDEDLKVFSSNNNDDSLDAWIIDESKGILRLTSTIKDKVEQYKRRIKAGTIKVGDYNVLAINGGFVTNPAFSQSGNNLPPNMRFGFLMHCACYGLTGQAGFREYPDGTHEYGLYKGSIHKKEKKMPSEVNHCFGKADFPFDGILYSPNMECYMPSKFIYFQNPNGKNLTEFFKFCEVRTKDTDVF